MICLFPVTAEAQSLQQIYSGLDDPSSISVTQNRVYVVEQGQNRLLKLDHDGNLIETIGGRGSGNYQFSKPVDVDATNGLKIFVTDYNNRRVQVFDRRGQYLSSISNRNAFGAYTPYNPTQIAVSKLGEVYFLDSETQYIHHFDLDFNLLDEFSIPPEINQVQDIEITLNEMLIPDRSEETIHRLALNGSYIGFYAAKDVLALSVVEGGIWKVMKKQVIFQSNDKGIQVIDLKTPIQAIDADFSDQYLFILTSDALYKLSVNQ